MDIDRILKLARIEMSEEEKKNLEKDFSSILGFVKKLEKLNVSNVKVMSYPIDVYNVMREDKKIKSSGKQKSKNLIMAAPETEKNYIKVKEVL